MALAEPENTLRAETLQALQVQKPRTRALWAWFEARGLFCATLVLDEDGPLGFLTLPRAERSQTLTLEEARAARRLTDRLSALVALTSTLSRARRRETELVVRAEQAESRFQEARRVIDGQTSRERELARTLAKPLLSAAYSPAARLALAAVEQQARQGGPILLLAAVGVDATAWAAAAHTTGNGRPGAFLAVDAALEARGPERRFADPENSPWQLCRGGTLFIKDVHLLPESAQQDLLSALSSADPNGAWPSALLIASLATSASESPPLALPKLLMPLFKLPALELPTLKNRPEDLRALILDAIARQPGGEQARGVERRAMQALMDHGWPGNERELNDVVERATLHARGPLVTLEDLRAVGFAVDTTDSQFALAPLARPESPISPRPSSPPPRRRSRAPRPRARG
jgi:transcriptional regulator with GAF, ATPase, and Fis domain